MENFADWRVRTRAILMQAYDEILVPEFEEEWKRREEKHSRELESARTGQHESNNNVSHDVSGEGFLAASAKELEVPQNNGSTIRAPQNERDGNTPTAFTEDYQHLRDKFCELQRMFKDLSQKTRYFERKNNVIMQKNKDMKESVRAWQEYTNRQSGKRKLQIENERLQTPSVYPQDDGILLPLTAGVEDYPDLIKSEPLRPTTSQAEGPRYDRIECSEGHNVSSYSNTSAIPSNDQGSSQTTQDESTARAFSSARIRDTADEDDIPQFLSARSLKRKRDLPFASNFKVFADRCCNGSPAQPLYVKEEPQDSPPPLKVMRTETFDLDSPAPHVLMTPRRSRRRDAVQGNTIDTLRHQRSSSVPFLQKLQDYKTPLKPLDCNVLAGADHTSSRRRLQSLCLDNESNPPKLKASKIKSERPPQSQKKQNPILLNPEDGDLHWPTPKPNPNGRRKIHRSEARLRSRPMTEINIRDFKPNPAFNQGYSYAFAEAVRKRGDRMCLPGCTNPQCCGSTFRAFAEAQGDLPPSQEESLLECFLGDVYDATQINQMSSDERKELILQARTKKLANQVGKHREAYERRKTPPNFWRVDFPSTQEQNNDHEKAKQQEKAIVKERWLEAQRQGGRWIFRDE